MNKVKKLFLLLTPIIVVASGVITFLAVSQKTKGNVFFKDPGDQTQVGGGTNIKDPHDIYKDIQIFPDLSPSSFYTYLRMSSNSEKPLINDDMILFIINYIIKNMVITEGNISIGYNKINDYTVKIQALWEHEDSTGNHAYTHTYIFSATNSI